jgi:co-chaperonin GroES (HSP10)
MYKLIGNTVLIEDVEIVTQTPGGLYIPEETVKKTIDVEKGKVITYGTIADQFAVGDIVTYKKHAYAIKVVINNKPYKIVEADDIISIERDD